MTQQLTKVAGALQTGDVLVITTGPIPEGVSTPVRQGHKAFRALTRAAQGATTHAAMYVGNGEIVEARIGEGVLKRPMKEALKGLKAVAFRPPATKKSRKFAADFASTQVGKPYDGVALLMAGTKVVAPEMISNRIVTERDLPDDVEAFTCSNLISAAYAAAGEPISEVKKWHVVSPVDLRYSGMKKVRTINTKGSEVGSAVPWIGKYRGASLAGQEKKANIVKWTDAAMKAKNPVVRRAGQAAASFLSSPTTHTVARRLGEDAAGVVARGGGVGPEFFANTLGGRAAQTVAEKVLPKVGIKGKLAKRIAAGATAVKRNFPGATTAAGFIPQLAGG